MSQDMKFEELAANEPEETTPGNMAGSGLAAVYDVPVTVSAVLGRSVMPVSNLLKLSRGSVVELDRKVGDSIDILVNGRLIARGEIVMVDDTRLGVTMTEIIKSEKNA